MEAGKTGALLGCAASIGAVLAGADDEIVAALDRFGMELGLSFQAVDDLLGIWGDPATTGKPTWSDLRQHKKSLPVAAALASGAPGAAELAALLLAEHLEESEVARAAELVEECGGTGCRHRRRPRLHLEQAALGARWTRPRESSVARARRSSPTSSSRGSSEMTVLDRSTAATCRAGQRHARASADIFSGSRADDGWWKGDLETNVTMDAEDLMLREFLGVRDREDDRGRGTLDPLAAA